MTELAAALHIAPSDVAADAIRDGIILEVQSSFCREGELPELFRRAAAELAMLATVWHEPQESFSILLDAGIARGMPSTQARGILIGAFGCDPTLSEAIGNGRVRQSAEQEFASKARRTMAASGRNERLSRFQCIALECGAHVAADTTSRPDAADLLAELAQSSGISDLLRADDLQHLISEAFHGRAATVERSTPSKIAERTAPRGRHLVMRCAADITPEPISWLWPHRIAIGKLTLLAGQPGLGKSQIMAAIAAATSTGAIWPCNEGVAPLGSVIVLSAEDDAADTQIPRLLAAGAHCRKIHIISAVREKDAAGNRTFNIQADLDLIEGELDRLRDVLLLSIDPLSSYLGKIDSHNNTEVRAVLERLSEMAARRRVAVVGVTHFNKGEGSAINKIIGLIAFTAAARGAWMVAIDPDDENRRLFVSIKNNVGRPAPALAFRVAQIAVGERSDIIAPYIVWDADPVSDMTADQVLAAGRAGDSRAANVDAADMLLSVLASGAVAVEVIQADAVAAGLLKEGGVIGKDKAFRLARAKLGVSRDNGTVFRVGGTGSAGQWFWRLPPA